MSHQVRLKSAAEREALISSAVSASRQTNDFYEFRGQKTELPFVRVSESALVYRMENFRTYIDQKEYILREHKDEKFFLTGQENESVQQLQHDILAKLAGKGVSDSVVPVIEVLRTDKQREPLIVTFRGVVVNGNRRLAGMRELLKENGQLHSTFSHIDCLVLPKDATPNEIVDIEAALQAKPETRLDYDWIGDCLLIQRLLESHKNVEVVAQRLNRKPSEIRNSLAALTEANMYLRDWAKADGEYSRVVDAEQLFKDLPTRLDGKSPELADASRMIAWNLFDSRDDLSQRVYAYNLTFGKRAADVLNRVATNMNISMKPIASSDDASFDVDMGESDQAVSYAKIIEAFRNPKTKEEARETLIDVCKGVLETEKGLKGGAAALKTLSQINGRLADVDVGASDPATYAEIEKHLVQISSRVAGLRSIVRKLRGDRDE